VSIWQIIDWAMLTAAIWYGRPSMICGGLMVINLAAGMVVESPLQLGVVDLVTAILMFGWSRRSDVVAVLLLIAAVLNCSMWAFGFSDYAIYAILDGMAWVQFGALGGVDRGIGNMYRRRHFWLGDISQRSARAAMARVTELDSEGLNGPG
jgi:hypothetical protein